jgi:glyoxylase-like metal-dependent hydrolase (beta-lactamase superfamily II)/rhodanese-related sulfurtransferase
MIFEQYYLGCLSQASYLIGDETTGVAAVVDPRRDIGEYLADAERHGLRIAHVLETHFHADFVSGHLELAAVTGAEICYGVAAETDYPVRHLAHGERLALGEVELECRSTPGHTPESVCYLVFERGDDVAPVAVLTGDTLFVGDVGRPDLLAAAGATPESMARRLFRSLRDELLTLPDETRVYPAHGAGSACGRSLASETWSTIGDQRLTNYALRLTDEDAFVAAITDGQPEAPPYFSIDSQLNRQQRPLLDEEHPPPVLDWDALMGHVADGAAILDTRSPQDFAAGHVRSSVNVGLDGRFAELAGEVLDPGHPVVLVSDDGSELEAKIRLGRVGFDRILGALERPEAVLAAHPDDVVTGSRLRADELAERMAELDGLLLVDVRGPGETEAGTIPGAVEIPLPALARELDRLDPERPTVVYCASGFRSSIAASVLRAQGFADVSDLLGGYAAWSVLTPA